MLTYLPACLPAALARTVAHLPDGMVIASLSKISHCRTFRIATESMDSPVHKMTLMSSSVSSCARVTVAEGTVQYVLRMEALLAVLNGSCRSARVDDQIQSQGVNLR
jgi:hypothetical protein